MQTRIPTPKTFADRHLRYGQALTLRRSGRSYASIGSALGIGRTRARQIVARAERPHWHDDLPGRVRTFLHSIDLTALPEIEAANAVARFTHRELLSVPNIGRAACDAVIAWLARHDLTLRSP
jgi:hypothetical protein